MVLDEQQTEKLHEWLRETGELFIDVYPPHSGGSSTDYFVRSIQDLEKLIAEQTWPMLTVTVFRRLQYPIRGIADNKLLEIALQNLPDNCYRVLLVSDEGYYPYSCIHVGSGDSHQELIEEFPEFGGQFVGIGQNPFDFDTDWIEKSPSEAMVLKLTRGLSGYISD